jgi:hypothetical protein
VLHYRLAPGEQEQLLRVFAPDLSAWTSTPEGDKLLQLHHGRQGEPATAVAPAAPRAACRSSNRWTSLRLVSGTSCPAISLDRRRQAADDQRQLLFGLLGGVLILHNLIRFAYTAQHHPDLALYHA